jgi:histidine ammonia-lyase
MDEYIVLDGQALSVPEVVAVARGRVGVALGDDARRRMQAARAVVEAAVALGEPAYGVNTGFGELSRVRIPAADVVTLQRNLLMSHAAGVGEPLPEEVVRAMLLLLAASLSRGYSGVRPLVVEAIVDLLNRGVSPVVPSKGSLGASGDLAPLAHIGLVLIGLGEATSGGERLPGRVALERAGRAPLELAAKEGLALINGTHLMAAVGALAIHDARVIVESAEAAAAMSLEALRGTDVPFDARIQAVRQQDGQAATAAHVRALLAGSAIIPSHREDDPRVQDPYSLRCVPQVIGAVRDTVDHCARVIGAELGAVTDNPLCFPDDGVILSGGNFHGQPVALALDILALALAELAAFGERRIYLLLDDREPAQDRLPPFLAREPGLNSGYMIAQYVAAALVAENAVLATPAGVHSVPTSAGMEDFVSMGATAALKARTIVENAAHVVSIELLCASQGVEYRRPLRAGHGVEEAVRRVRAVVPPLERDRPLHADIAALARSVHEGRFVL